MNCRATRIAREASAEYGATESTLMTSQAYYLAKINAYVKDSGVSVTFFESHLMEENDEIDLVANYTITPPFSIIGLGRYHFRQRVHTRAFTGVERRDSSDTDDTIVYITETGRVYHRSLECTYLKLSISQVKYGDLEDMRNSGGGIYKACEKCSEGKSLGDGDDVWVTNYGDRYHTSRACSGLKRTISEVPLSEVGDRAPCSKCGKEGEDE